MAASARSYAESAWMVFPIEAGGKAPLIPKSHGGNGYHDATDDLEQIDAWWHRNPGANVGVACRPSGLVVIDVDRRHGGDTSIGELQARHGPIGARCVAETPNGWHAYFVDPDGPLAGTLCSGVDVKANGYVVAPPSTRPDGVYRWLRIAAPGLLPDWAVAILRPRPAPTRRLVDWTRPGPDVQRNVRAIVQVAATAAAGNRNSAVWWAARKLAADHIPAGTLTVDDIVTLLVAAAAASGVLTDDGERGTTATIMSGIRRGLTDRVAVPA